MAEEFDNEQDEQETPPEGDGIKKLREAAKRGERASAELATLRMELAATKANINTDSPLAKRLLTSYDGDMTPEALTTFFKDLGADSVFNAAPGSNEVVIPETPDPANPTLTPLEIAAADQRKNLASGGVVPDGTSDTPDPWIAGIGAFQDAMQKGDTRATASGAAFQQVFAAAHNGDPRVLVARHRD